MDHVAVYDPLNDRMIVNSGYDTRTTWALNWRDSPTKVLISAGPVDVTIYGPVKDASYTLKIYRRRP